MIDIQTRVKNILVDMWRYRWLGLALSTLVAAIGIGVISKMRDQYSASARIFVDTQSVLKPLMAGLAVQPDVTQQVAMLGRTLISRPNVEKLLRMSDLDLNVRTDEQRQEAVARLMKDLRISSAGRDNLYYLSYNDADPERAKRAVQSLVSIFVESGMNVSRKDADSAKAFINEQIKNYQAKLEEAEARLKEFRLKNLDIQVGDGRDTASKLTQLTADLDRARLELNEAERAREAAKTALAAELSAGANLSTQSVLQESALSVSTPELDARIEAQKRNLDGLLQRFTDLHPDVVSARRVIQDLEDERRKQIAELRRVAIRTAAPAPTQAETLATQELKRMLATAEVNSASLRARVNEYSSRVAHARAALKTAPKLEAEAAQLNRDYAIHKKNYEDLVARRETASISGQLDEVSGVADFRLIDPPFVNPKPIWPNRTALVALALAGALASGLLAAFAASTLRPVFHHVGELRGKLGVPVLGVVSTVMSEADKARKNMAALRFSGAFVGLLLAYGLAVFAMRHFTRV